MASGVKFQSGQLASPPAGTVIATDEIVTGGVGTHWQSVKLDVGPSGTSVPLHYAAGTGLPVAGVGTFQTLGSIQGVGTFQALGTVQAHGTAQVLGSVQAVGTIQTREVRSTAPTTTSVAATVGNIILLAANPSRFGAAVYLEDGAALYLKLGSLAGTLDYTLQMTAGGYYEVPFRYQGTISGIWKTAGGTARITEVL